MKLPIFRMGFLLLLLIGQGCSFPSGPTKTSPFPQLAPSGPETWRINNKDYRIESTYITPFPNGDVQFTINYMLDGKLPADINDDMALEIAYPMIQYAYNSKPWSDQTVLKNGKKIEPQSIGVALISKNKKGIQGFSISSNNMFRISLSFKEIQDRINKAQP